MGQELVYVVDTPELDNATRSESEVLEEMTRFLAIQHESGCKLRGIIFLHPITQPTTQDSAPTYVQMFQELCGREASGNLMVLTTRWDEVDIHVGSQRHQELQSEARGATTRSRTRVRKFLPASASLAQSLIGRVFENGDIVLQIQTDVMHHDKSLNETSAGRFVIGRLDGRFNKLNEHMAELTKDPGYAAGLNKKIEQRISTMMADLQHIIASKRRLGIAVRGDVQQLVQEKGHKSGQSKSSIRTFSEAVGWSIAAAMQSPSNT